MLAAAAPWISDLCPHPPNQPASADDDRAVRDWLGISGVHTTRTASA